MENVSGALNGTRREIHRAMVVTHKPRRSWKAALSAGASSVLASATDLVVLFALIRIAHFSPGWAAVLGCIAGGVVNFTIKRRYIFASGNARRSLAKQVALYSLLVVAK